MATAGPGPQAGPAAADPPAHPRQPRVYWEMTRACDLACRHCRAEAMAGRDPDELTTAEARRLLEALVGFGPPAPHVIFTGGDPFKRPDFWALLEHAAGLGLALSVAPSGTPALTAEAIRRLRATGVAAISLSLDGPDAARHDELRGVPGCFQRTIEAAAAAADAGLPVQVNTLVAAETAGDLFAIGDLAERVSAARWSLFFLVQVGRGRVLGPIEPEACERLLGALWARSRAAPLVVTTTEAPHYRRIALQCLRAAGATPDEIRRSPVRHGFGIRDGNGILFVSHRGDVTPSGFLPLVTGNVRRESPVALYREAPLFRRLRATAAFPGRCGRCEYREICGGSRARAWAATGDPCGDDPLCLYQPAARPVRRLSHRAVRPNAGSTPG